jgi:hypothetical protein
MTTTHCRLLKVTVSGSFHRHMDAITAAVQDLANRGIRVLSPADPRVVANQGEFLFVASDRVRSVRLVQDRHLESVRAADFLWLVCPDRYVGQSAAMEIGFAAGAGTPIFATHCPMDLTLREYVSVVSSIAEAVNIVSSRPQPLRTEGLLIDPHASIARVQKTLEHLDLVLASRGAPEAEVKRGLSTIWTDLAMPTTLQ